MKFTNEVETLIQALISSFYLKRQRPRVADLHRQVMLECRRTKLTPPSYKAVWVRVNAIDPALAVRAREGASAARDKFTTVKKGLTPKRPLELAQIGHTLEEPRDRHVASLQGREPAVDLLGRLTGLNPYLSTELRKDRCGHAWTDKSPSGNKC